MIINYICPKRTKDKSSALTEVHRWNISFLFFFFYKNDLFTTDAASCYDHLEEKKESQNNFLYIKMKKQMFSISFQKYPYGPSSFRFFFLPHFQVTISLLYFRQTTYAQ
jgi:hypothetical protein